MALLITTDGTERTVTPANGPTFTLEELQQYVGGYVEVLRVGEQFYLLDEDGKRKKRAPNNRATWRAHAFLRDGDFIVGDVLICTLADFEILDDDVHD